MRKRYEAEVGPVRNLPEDHPDRWQWDYRGSKDERDDLLSRLAGEKKNDKSFHLQESLLDA